MFDYGCRTGHGIYRAITEERPIRRRAFLDDLKVAAPVYPDTDATAELVGKISGGSSAKGVIPGLQLIELQVSLPNRLPGSNIGAGRDPDDPDRVLCVRIARG